MSKLTKTDGDVTRSHVTEQTDEEALAEALAALAAAAANIPAPEEESDEAKRSRLESAESAAQAALDAALKHGVWERTHQARKVWKLAADELERFESEQDRMDAMSANIRERLAKIDAAQSTQATWYSASGCCRLISGLPFAIPEARCIFAPTRRTHSGCSACTAAL